MSVDTVSPTLSGQAVHPKPDARDSAGRNPRREKQPDRQPQDQEDPPNPLLNSLGQVIGQTINITA